MNELSLISKIKRLKTDLSHMTYQEKLQHIWTYYKWIIPVVLVVIMLISILLASITNRSKVTMMGGIAVNVPLSDAGEAYLMEDYREHFGLTSKRQSVVFTETYIYSAENTTDYADNYYSLMSLLALCSNEQVDYLLLNEEAISVLMVHQVFQDLREIYTQEELDAFGDRVIWLENTDTNEAMPVVLEITDIPFIQDNTNISGKVFFGYITNSPRPEETKALYDYLLAWKADE